MSTYKLPKTLATSALTLVLSAVLSGNAQAITAEQAKRIHDRLVGTPPSAACLTQMVGAATANDAAIDAINDTGGSDNCKGTDFYRVTLKNFITPWTNEAQTVFDALNDYTATLIGIIRDEYDFRRALYDDILYTGPGATTALANSNAHYKNLEDTGADLQTVLSETQQSTIYPSIAPAGIFTTRAGARAFFIDGTNRAMFRFTMMNHLCNDMEQVKDTSYPPDRIRQDVSRSPGGDSRIYMNACIGCHNAMDPLTQAFAYYNYIDVDGDLDTDDGHLEYTNGSVQPKNLINANNFEYGYVTTNDDWTNYWRTGSNSALGWDTNGLGLPGSGSGAASMGQELANSEAFARCQVKKVFKAVCLRAPLETADQTQIDTMTSTFKGNGYNLKQIFADSAVYCMGS